MKRDAQRIGRQLLAIGALAVLVTACGGGPSTSAAPSASPVPSSPAPTVPASTSPEASPVPSEGLAIDKLQPFIPSDVWRTCEPTILLHFPATVQGATCRMAGVDAVTYELFDNSADLAASFDSIAQGTHAQPSADMATACAKGNWSGTWNRTGTAIIPGNSFECDTNVSGAWIVQADPKVNVLFQANLASGNGAALQKWWLDNVTVVEP